jgi:hypothetical protein
LAFLQEAVLDTRIIFFRNHFSWSRTAVFAFSLTGLFPE